MCVCVCVYARVSACQAYVKLCLRCRWFSYSRAELFRELFWTQMHCQYNIQENLNTPDKTVLIVSNQKYAVVGSGGWSDGSATKKTDAKRCFQCDTVMFLFWCIRKKRKSCFHSNVLLFNHIYNIFVFCSLLGCKRLDLTQSQNVARRKRLQAKRRLKLGFIVSPWCTMVCLWRQAAGQAARKEVVEPVWLFSASPKQSAAFRRVV